MLIEKYGQEKRWVNWRLEERDGKPTKVPYFSKSKMASSTNVDTWRTYQETAESFDNGSNNFSGVGIILHDSKLVCIDIDHVVEGGKVVGQYSGEILKLLKKANSFTEISQSGTGLHIFIEVSTSFTPLVNKKAPFEIYTNGRYIATTNNPFREFGSIPVRTVDETEILKILSTIGYPWGKDIENTSPVASSFLTDEEVVSKMFKKDKAKKLYEGDISEYDNDDSRADSALLTRLAFWTCKNPQQMERIWLASPLGKREKTQKVKQYRERSIVNAITVCKEIYEIPPQSDKSLDLMFTLNEKGERTYILNIENIARVLRNHKKFTGRFRFESFKNKMQCLVNDKWVDIDDTMVLNILTEISVLLPCFAKLKKDMVNDAVMIVCYKNIYDSAKEYLSNLKWDNVYRLDSWLSNVYGTDDDEYHKKVGSNWIKGLVKRIMVPGCKFDYVLVLEGAQGIKKSTSLAVLGRDWHLETMKAPDNKDFFMDMAGKAIVEFSEGESMSRTDIKRLKAVITTQVDTYRPSYGRHSMDFPRRCVFAMTTNQSEYLKDETGNRRWLPVSCKKVSNIEWLELNRDQLFAEAYERVIKRNETTWEFPEEETKKQQESRRIEDPNTEMIVDWYLKTCTKLDKLAGITLHQVYMQAFHGNSTFVSKGMTKPVQMSIADVLKTTLKLEKRQVMEDGIRIVKWFDKNLQSDIDTYLQGKITIKELEIW